MCHFIRNVVIMHESMKSKWNGARIELLWVHIDIGLWILLMHDFHKKFMIRRTHRSTHFLVLPLLWYGYLIRSSCTYSILHSVQHLFVCTIVSGTGSECFHRDFLSNDNKQHTIFLFILSTEWFFFLLWYRIRALIAFGVLSYIYKTPHLSLVAWLQHQQ